jgi:aryl-alcohol dehydrogenase-like predicted oxidoreductase
METVNMGKSGLQVSKVGLGCNNFGATIDLDASRKVIHAALDLGVTLLDTSDNYGTVWGDTELMMGELLEGVRDRFILGTKFGVPAPGKRDSSRWWINRAVERSLKRMRTDYLDLYMIHWPDPKTPMEETLRALDDLVKSGKVRYIGLSNHNPWQIVEAKWLAKEMNSNSFIFAQNEYSLLNRKAESELIPALAKYGMALQPYFPLAGGMLTGKYLNGREGGRLTDNWSGLKNVFLTERNSEIVKNLDAFAVERGRTMIELAMSWLACQPTVAGIISGATTAEQLQQNVNACSWALSADEIAEINAIAA